MLSVINIDRSHSIPLHHQLYLELRRLIIQEKLSAGSSLPQVGDICRALGLSTITVSRAITELKREGRIVTRRGVGIFVANRLTPVTEVIGWGGEAFLLTPGTFLFPLVDGLKKGLNEPGRRCVLTCFDEQPPSVQEIRDLMRNRNADSLVVFRPKPSIIQAARLLSADFATVMVFDRPVGWSGDSVVAAPEKALRRILSNRVKAGCRHFAYLGKKGLQALSEEVAPYHRLATMFKKVMAESRLEAEVHIAEDPPFDPATGKPVANVDQQLGAQTRDLPSGSVVVADTPHVADQVLAQNPKLDVITYTETLRSVEQFKARMTLLYCGLDSAGETTAQLLRGRLANPHLPPRTEKLDAKVVGDAAG